ncbi:MAG: hypothetical protein JWO06_762 [Bacteroidota bacterium]|nr:hypothetical protein [Bacteroidota bacterium]
MEEAIGLFDKYRALAKKSRNALINIVLSQFQQPTDVCFLLHIWLNGAKEDVLLYQGLNYFSDTSAWFLYVQHGCNGWGNVCHVNFGVVFAVFYLPTHK